MMFCQSAWNQVIMGYTLLKPFLSLSYFCQAFCHSNEEANTQHERGEERISLFLSLIPTLQTKVNWQKNRVEFIDEN
jgi:hypothetical protein